MQCVLTPESKRIQNLEVMLRGLAAFREFYSLVGREETGCELTLTFNCVMHRRVRQPSCSVTMKYVTKERFWEVTRCGQHNHTPLSACVSVACFTETMVKVRKEEHARGAREDHTGNGPQVDEVSIKKSDSYTALLCYLYPGYRYKDMLDGGNIEHDEKDECAQEAVDALKCTLGMDMVKVGSACDHNSRTGGEMTMMRTSWMTDVQILQMHLTSTNVRVIAWGWHQ